MLNEGEYTAETPSHHLPASYSAHPPYATPQPLDERVVRLVAERERFLFTEQIGGLGTFDWNVADNQITWSPALEGLYGLPPGGFEGKYENWVRYVHPADLPLVEASLQQTVRGEGAYQVEFRVIWPDGSVHWLLAKGDLYTYDPKQAKRILGINIDITDLKQSLANSHFLAEASKYLSASLDYEEALAHVVSLAASGMADWCRIDLLEKDGTLSQFTGAPTGYADSTWLRLSQQQTFTPERRVGVWQALQTRKPVLAKQITDGLLVALANNEQEGAWLRAAHCSSATIVPIILHNKAQGAITFLSGQSPFSASDAELLMLEELANRIALALENAHVYQDLQHLNTNLEALVMQRTEALLETAETLRQLNRELERSNQELQDFAHVASHDLQEPLRKIQAFGNLLAEEYGAELGDGHMYIERMRKAAARIQVRINDLLAFARVTSKAQPCEQVDLNVIARDVLDDLENRIQTSGGQVEVGPLPTIEADAFQNAIERKKAEQERGSFLREQLASKELERKKNEFISMVVHEIKTPLTSLKGFTQLLQRKVTASGESQLSQFAARIDAQSNKLTTLIDDLLDVTRIEGETFQFEEDFFTFDDLVDEVIEEIQIVSRTPELRREGRANSHIWGDRKRIGQVVTNFLTNALKYAYDTEIILLKTRADAETLTFCIQDFGSGIPKDQQARIFEPYYRVEAEKQKNIAGLGLGLFIAAEIIRGQHGQIWVESQEGQGATFCFTLPVVVPASVQVEQE
jgi:signal transduction histidine kinase